MTANIVWNPLAGERLVSKKHSALTVLGSGHRDELCRGLAVRHIMLRGQLDARE
ncbi:MAG: hypothetical protein KatS3mg113_0361 [Planctomycetaceae bacterium]|nr:MAG: hypothetical protein KatS3mg113_0361 [Planctomycetaceae bacterium]